MAANTVKSNWHSRYRKEVQIFTAYCEKINALNARNTTVRKVTPEEKIEWERSIQKRKENYLLKHLIKNGKISEMYLFMNTDKQKGNDYNYERYC